jgi:hypothetical protein
VNNNKLAGAAVSLGKMAGGSVDTSKVVDNSLTGADVDETKLDGDFGNATLAGRFAVDGFRPSGLDLAIGFRGAR